MDNTKYDQTRIKIFAFWLCKLALLAIVLSGLLTNYADFYIGSIESVKREISGLHSYEGFKIQYVATERDEGIYNVNIYLLNDNNLQSDHLGNPIGNYWIGRLTYEFKISDSSFKRGQINSQIKEDLSLLRAAKETFGRFSQKMTPNKPFILDGILLSHGIQGLNGLSFLERVGIPAIFLFAVFILTFNKRASFVGLFVPSGIALILFILLPAMVVVGDKSPLQEDWGSYLEVTRLEDRN